MYQKEGFTKRAAAATAAGSPAGAEPPGRGRETRYQLTPEPLAAAMSWMAAVGSQWDDRLAALQRYLETPRPRPRRRRTGFGPEG